VGAVVAIIRGALPCNAGHCSPLPYHPTTLPARCASGGTDWLPQALRSMCAIALTRAARRGWSWSTTAQATSCAASRSVNVCARVQLALDSLSSLSRGLLGGEVEGQVSISSCRRSASWCSTAPLPANLLTHQHPHHAPPCQSLQDPHTLQECVDKDRNALYHGGGKMGGPLIGGV